MWCWWSEPPKIKAMCAVKVFRFLQTIEFGYMGIYVETTLDGFFNYMTTIMRSLWSLCYFVYKIVLLHGHLRWNSLWKENFLSFCGYINMKNCLLVFTNKTKLKQKIKARQLCKEIHEQFIVPAIFKEV